MKPNEAAEKQEIMYRLKNAGELYVLLSMCTGEPYVVCDQETYDDEIIVWLLSKSTNSYSRLSLQIYWNFRNLTGRENCVPLW